MKINALTSRKAPESGKRVSGSSLPQIVAGSTYNQFTVNDKGRELLGLNVVEVEDPNDPTKMITVDNTTSRIVLYDPEAKADELGIRFFAFRGFVGNKQLFGAKLGKTYGFTYSPVWGAVMAANPALKDGAQEVREISTFDMGRFGILADKERKIAAFKCAMDIVPVYTRADGELVLNDEDGTLTPAYIDAFGEEGATMRIDGDNNKAKPVQLFALVNATYTAHDPKGESN